VIDDDRDNKEDTTMTLDEPKIEMNHPWFAQLLAEQKAPCVSLYMPLNRTNPAAAENPRVFQELVDQMRQIMSHRYDKPMIEEVLGKVQSVAGDEGFWTGDRDGMAIFASADILQVVDLPEPVEELVVVSDSFHIKPLIRIMQSADRFQILCLELKSVRMLEGNSSRLERLEDRHLPQSPADVAGMSLSHESNSASDLAQASKQNAQGNGAVEPVPVANFCRAVDRAVWENYSRPSGLPLILCADEKTQAAFRGVSKNQYLLDQGIFLDPKALPLDRLREEAWKIMQPIYQQQLDRITNDFRTAKAHRRGSDELAQVAEAASVGRVGTLLVASDKHIVGRLVRNSGKMEQAQPDDGVAVLRQDGQVLVLPQVAMPSDTGVAAIYRY
jgi:hypothetical protein